MYRLNRLVSDQTCSYRCPLRNYAPVTLLAVTTTSAAVSFRACSQNDSRLTCLSIRGRVRQCGCPGRSNHQSLPKHNVRQRHERRRARFPPPAIDDKNRRRSLATIARHISFPHNIVTTHARVPLTTSTTAMSQFALGPDPLVQASIARRQKLEEERKQRFFNPRTRCLGVGRAARSLRRPQSHI